MAAQRAQGGDHFCRVESTRGVEGPTNEIDHSFDLVTSVEVVGLHPQEVELIGVTDHEGARVKRLPPEFVKVDGDRVGALDPRQTTLQTIREKKGPRDRRIHVEPCTYGMGSLSNLGEGIDDAEVGGPGGRDDGNDPLSIARKLVERGVECVDTHEP